MKFAALLFAAVLFVTSAFAIVPTTMTYQAIFTDLEGNVMPDGVYEIGFHIFSSPVGGPPVWSEWQDVTVTDGVFEVILGTWNPLAQTDFLDPEGDGVWLSLSYNDTWMNPRQFISSVPFAFIACLADSARKLGIHTPESLTDFINSTNNFINSFVARQVTSFIHRETSVITIDEDDETEFSTPNFSLNVPSIVTFWGTVGEVNTVDEDEFENYTTIRVDIVNVNTEQVVASSITTGAALPGSPSVQTISAQLPAGTYQLVMELFCEDQEVQFHGFELGALYQSAPTR